MKKYHHNENDKVWQDGYLTAEQSGSFHDIYGVPDIAHNVWIDGYCKGLEKILKEEDLRFEIAIASDHGGFEMSRQIVEYLDSVRAENYVDYGPFRHDPQDDYPDYAREVCEYVREYPVGRRGVLLCGTGVGMCIAANKIKDIRAAVCQNVYVANQCVEHGNCNVICFGSHFTNFEQTRKCLLIYLFSNFSDKMERHQRRLEKISKIEAHDYDDINY